MPKVGEPLEADLAPTHRTREPDEAPAPLAVPVRRVSDALFGTAMGTGMGPPSPTGLIGHLARSSAENRKAVVDDLNARVGNGRVARLISGVINPTPPSAGVHASHRGLDIDERDVGAEQAPKPAVAGRALQRQTPAREPNPGPTYGNTPRDEPHTGVRRVQLKVINGKWREVSPDGRWRRAGGTYAFVVQDGTVYGVKFDWRAGARAVGHTEAAQGGRVTWAGRVHISGNSGQVTYWDDASGHYRPASSLRESAVQAGLPADRWQQAPETTPRPHPVTGRPTRPPDTNPQLPVEQPRTQSTTGGPAKVGPGPPRLGELEEYLRSGGQRPIIETTGKPPPTTTGQTPPTTTGQAPPTTTGQAPPTTTGQAPPTTTKTPPATTKTTNAPGIDITAPKLTLRGFGRMAGGSLLMLLAGLIFSQFTERAIQRLIDKQIKALEPRIEDLVRRAIEQSVPAAWLQQNPRLPFHVYITLDAARDGMFDGDLLDYYWSLPAVSIDNVYVTTPSIARGFGMDRDGPWKNPYFERIGLGTVIEHNYFTTKVPLESLIAR